MVSRLATALFLIKLSSVIPVDGIVSIGRPVPLYFSTDTPMVFPDATTDFSERESGKRHMTNNIALFSGKMMVGHDGLLSGLSVGRASLYQKTRHVLSLSHVVQLQVESTSHTSAVSPTDNCSGS
jgi:hypothetical protein